MAEDAVAGRAGWGPSPHLLCLGAGYVARFFARAGAHGWPESCPVTGTARTEKGAERLEAAGITPLTFDGGAVGIAAVRRCLADGATHLLISIPPDRDVDGAADPALRCLADDVVAAARVGRLRWVGYLSTTGVYGDRGGGWVDESAPLRPGSPRSERRAAAERGWLSLWRDHGVPVHVFRLAGIYGPGRNVLARARAGTLPCVHRPGQAFGRVHVADISRALRASCLRPSPGAVWNVCDDAPASPAEVAECAHRLLGLAPPPRMPPEAAGLSPMARSFWRESRRVSNSRLKGLLEGALGAGLLYPDYEAGLSALLAAGEGSGATA